MTKEIVTVLDMVNRLTTENARLKAENARLKADLEEAKKRMADAILVGVSR